MRKSEVELLFDHVYWVNHRLLHAAAHLSPEQFIQSKSVTTRDRQSTLVPELDVEWSWRLNLQGRPMEEIGPDQELRAEDFTDIKTLRERWACDEAEMRDWLSGLSDDDLERSVDSAFSGDRRPLWQYLFHIVTHAAQQQADGATWLTIHGRSPGELGFLAYLVSGDRSGAAD